MYTERTFAAESLATATRYDGLHRVVRTVTPEGRPTEMRYNRLGQLVATITPDLDGDGDGDPTNETLSGTPDAEYAYDDAGRLRFVRDPVRRNQGGTPSLLYTTYDAFGRPIDEGIAANPASTVFTSRSYLNSTTWPTTGRSEQTLYTYDTSTPSLSREGLTITNPVGRLVQVQFNSGQATGPNDGYTQYSYDGDGRTTGFHVYLEGLGHKQARYTFDRAGRPTMTQYQLYASDAQGWRTAYDAAGRATLQEGSPSGEFYYSTYPILSSTYDARGRMTGSTVMGTAAETFTTDVRGRMTGITATRVGPGTPVFSSAYTYTPNSLVDTAEWTQPLLTGSPLPQRLRYRYRYDGARRLAGATGEAWNGSAFAEPVPAYSFSLNGVTYDRDGNIMSLSRWRSGASGNLDGYGYSYFPTGSVPRSSRLMAVTDEGTAMSSFTYDRNGQATGIAGGPNAQTSLFGRNGLPYQTAVGSATLRYLYDHTGQRVYESSGSGRYTVRGAQGEVFAVYSGTSLQYHDMGVGRREASGARVAYVTDHLGSVRVGLESGGTTRSINDYYPFGLQMPGRVYVSGTPTREGFTGHELDAETGMNYAGARYYMPALGRFSSTDPHAASYPGWSPYHYAANNPVSVTDPTGMDWYSQTRDDGKTYYEWYDGSGARENWSHFGVNRTYTAEGGRTIFLGEGGAADWRQVEAAGPSAEAGLGLLALAGTGSAAAEAGAVGSLSTFFAPVVGLFTLGYGHYAVGSGMAGPDAQMIYANLGWASVLGPLVMAADFPNDRELARRLGVSEREIHEKKEEILGEVGMPGVRNPDIGFSPDGNIMLRDRRTGRQIDTGLPANLFGD